MNIAIFNTEARKAVTIVRSLGKAGHSLYSFSFERISFAGASRYVRKNMYLRGYDLPRITRLMKRYDIDCIFPIEDASIGFFGLNREHFTGYTLIAPEYEMFILFADKAKTARLAQQKGIKAPDVFIPDSIDEACSFLRDCERYPLIIKPRRATSAIGVKIVTNAEQGIARYLDLSKKFDLPLIQEYIPQGGKTIGAEFLFYEGREVLSFCHERIREFPVKRGPSTYCKNHKGDEALEIGRRLFDEMRYSGFAMVELKEHPGTKELYLMEINPRPWGSITLPVYAGVDFPLEAVRVFSDPEGYLIPADGSRYEKNKDYYMRWFLPGDLLSIILDPDMSLGEKMKNLFKRYPDTAYQIMSLNDPAPALTIMLKLFLNLFNVGYLRKYLLRKG
jgi:predicted ATP-grasp superfamily ATP-dependent carboligase